MDFHQFLCTDAVDSWFEIANRQISSFFFARVICLPHQSGGVLSFYIFYVTECYRYLS